MELRVKGGGESERRAVMVRIEVEQKASWPKATSPHAKASRLPPGILITRALGKPTRRESRWRHMCPQMM